MYVCMHAYMYVCRYFCTNVCRMDVNNVFFENICRCMQMYVPVRVRMYKYVYVCIHVCKIQVVLKGTVLGAIGLQAHCASVPLFFCRLYILVLLCCFVFFPLSLSFSPCYVLARLFASTSRFFWFAFSIFILLFPFFVFAFFFLMLFWAHCLLNRSLPICFASFMPFSFFLCLFRRFFASKGCSFTAVWFSLFSFFAR